MFTRNSCNTIAHDGGFLKSRTASYHPNLAIFAAKKKNKTNFGAGTLTLRTTWMGRDKHWGIPFNLNVVCGLRRRFLQSQQAQCPAALVGYPIAPGTGWFPPFLTRSGWNRWRVYGFLAIKTSRSIHPIMLANPVSPNENDAEAAKHILSPWRVF